MPRASARSGRAKTGDAHVALLRGINVGGKNKLPMKDVIDLFAAAGCEDIRTYIQSGNVIFRAGAALAKRIPDLITDAVRDRFGYRVPVVLRNTEELCKQMILERLLAWNDVS